MIDLGDVKLRHPNCQNNNCWICLQDHERLGQYLAEAANNDTVDHLGKYHSWLSTHDIDPETEWGWATPEAFDPSNISAYVKEYSE